MLKLTEEQLREIVLLARRLGVKELSLFGSALRPEDFGPDSDVDMAVSFTDQHAKGRFTAFMDLKEALEILMARPVDLISLEAIRNPVMRAELETSRRLLYAEAS